VKEVYIRCQDGLWRKKAEFQNYGRVTIVRDSKWRIVKVKKETKEKEEK